MWTQRPWEKSERLGTTAAVNSKPGGNGNLHKNLALKSEIKMTEKQLVTLVSTPQKSTYEKVVEKRNLNFSWLKDLKIGFRWHSKASENISTSNINNRKNIYFGFSTLERLFRKIYIQKLTDLHLQYISCIAVSEKIRLHLRCIT